MTRGQRDRRQQRSAAVQQAACPCLDIPSDLVAHPLDHGIRGIKFLAHAQATSRVIVYDRVSRRARGRTKLEHRGEAFARLLEKAGLEVATAASGEPMIFTEVCCGRTLDPAARPALFAALEAAAKHGLPLVTPCISRLIRSQDFNTIDCPDARPSSEQLTELQRLAAQHGVILTTWLSPGSTPAQDEAFLAELGRQITTRPQGRPPIPDRVPGYAKRRKAAGLDYARLMIKQGRSLASAARWLARRAGVDRATAYRWLRQLQGENQP